MSKKLITLAVLFLAPMAAMADGGVTDKGYYAIGAGIVLGLAAMGGTIGQGLVGNAAMEGIARNPQAVKALNTPMILTLALIESLVIISFLIAFLMQNRL